MENNYKLEKKETIFIIIMIMINKLILNVPYYIVNLVATGAIANIIYIGIIDFIFLLIILKLFKIKMVFVLVLMQYYFLILLKILKKMLWLWI